MKLQPVNHPVLGRLIPDLWGDSLMCFRQIPGLRMFGPMDSAGALHDLGQEDRKLVEGWKDQPQALAKRCRNDGVFRALRSLGVFEVAFPRNPTGTPSHEQVAAYQFFQENEEPISANIADALLRYYRAAWQADADWFEENDCRDLRSVDELASLATLDGLSYTFYACEGLAVVSLGWQVDWDMEHGLSMILWKDQVVGIGIDGIEELALAADSHLLWNRAHMTEAERAALARVSRLLDEDG